jgi:hypothetical protein
MRDAVVVCDEKVGVSVLKKSLGRKVRVMLLVSTEEFANNKPVS